MTETTTHRQVQMPLANDLYNIDSLLSEEERMVRDTVRKFVNERVLPIIGEHFEAGTFPRELIPEIAELGLLGMHLRRVWLCRSKCRLLWPCLPGIGSG